MDLFVNFAPSYYTYERIKFNNDTTIYLAKVWFYGALCELTFNTDDMPSNLRKTNTSYFELLDIKGNAYGKYSGYSTIYRIVDNVLIVSKDGSVYIG